MFVNLWIFDFSVTEFTDITARSGKNTLQLETRIELGAQSQLLAVAGSTVQIYYEITNLRMIPTFHNFQVVDELRFLQTLNPQSYVPSFSHTLSIKIYKNHILFSSTAECGFRQVKHRVPWWRASFHRIRKLASKIKSHSYRKRWALKVKRQFWP